MPGVRSGHQAKAAHNERPESRRTGRGRPYRAASRRALGGGLGLSVDAAGPGGAQGTVVMLETPAWAAERAAHRPLECRCGPGPLLAGWWASLREHYMLG